MKIVVDSSVERQLGELNSGDVFRFENEDDYYLFLTVQNDEYLIFNLCTNLFAPEYDGCLRVILFPNAVVQIQ